MGRPGNHKKTFCIVLPNALHYMMNMLTTTSVDHDTNLSIFGSHWAQVVDTYTWFPYINKVPTIVTHQTCIRHVPPIVTVP